MAHDHHQDHVMDHSAHQHHGDHNMEPVEGTFSPATAILNALTTIMPTGHDGHPGHVHVHRSGDNGSSGGHDMPMYFKFGCNVPFVLFEFWTINSIWGLIGSMIGIFLISMLYEGLKVLREYLLQRSLQNDASSRQSVGSSASSSGLRVPLAGEGDSVQESQNVVVIKSLFRPNPFSFAHGLQTLLHMLQMTISFLLMLIFMTYNVWLCLAVVLGAGAGYFTFGWRKRTIIDINEHCH